MKFSIITPSFKQLDYLKRCAASVEDQEGATVEHLIQDGAGGEELEAWASSQTFADVRIESDLGMYDAINRGFRRGKGEIMAWLNCDEQYLPGTLKAVADWFDSHPEHDIVFGDIVLVSADGTPLAYRQAIRPSRSHIRHCFLPTYSAATFVRRRVIDDGKLLDTRFRAIADAVWIHQLMGSGYRSGVLNRPLSIFTQTGNNLGQSEAGAEESRKWRGDSKFAAPCWSMLHRMRKLMAGCYRRRRVTLDVFMSDGASRERKEAELGEVWKNVPSV